MRVAHHPEKCKYPNMSKDQKCSDWAQNRYDGSSEPYRSKNIITFWYRTQIFASKKAKWCSKTVTILFLAYGLRISFVLIFRSIMAFMIFWTNQDICLLNGGVSTSFFSNFRIQFEIFFHFNIIRIFDRLVNGHIWILNGQKGDSSDVHLY